MSECGMVERIEDHPVAVTFAIHVPRSEFDPAKEQVIVEHLDLDMRDMGDGILAFADIGEVEDSRFRELSRETVDGTRTFRIKMTAPKAARGDADSVDTPTVEDGRTFLRYYTVSVKFLCTIWPPVAQRLTTDSILERCTDQERLM